MDKDSKTINIKLPRKYMRSSGRFFEVGFLEYNLSQEECMEDNLERQFMKIRANALSNKFFRQNCLFHEYFLYFCGINNTHMADNYTKTYYIDVLAENGFWKFQYLGQEYSMSLFMERQLIINLLVNYRYEQCINRIKFWKSNLNPHDFLEFFFFKHVPTPDLSAYEPKATETTPWQFYYNSESFHMDEELEHRLLELVALYYIDNISYGKRALNSFLIDSIIRWEPKLANSPFIEFFHNSHLLPNEKDRAVHIYNKDNKVGKNKMKSKLWIGTGSAILFFTLAFLLVKSCNDKEEVEEEQKPLVEYNYNEPQNEPSSSINQTQNNLQSDAERVRNMIDIAYDCVPNIQNEYDREAIIGSFRDAADELDRFHYTSGDNAQYKELKQYFYQKQKSKLKRVYVKTIDDGGKTVAQEMQEQRQAERQSQDNGEIVGADGFEYYITEQQGACYTKEDLDLLHELANAGDSEGINQMLMQGRIVMVGPGPCAMLDRGFMVSRIRVNGKIVYLESEYIKSK